MLALTGWPRQEQSSSMLFLNKSPTNHSSWPRALRVLCLYPRMEVALHVLLKKMRSQCLYPGPVYTIGIVGFITLSQSAPSQMTYTIHIHTYTHTCTHTHVRVNMHIYMHTHTCIYTHTHMHLHTYTHAYTSNVLFMNLDSDLKALRHKLVYFWRKQPSMLRQEGWWDTARSTRV